MNELSANRSRPCGPLQTELWLRVIVSVCQFANAMTCTWLMSLCSIAQEMHKVCRGPSASTMGRQHRVSGTEAHTRAYR